MFDDWQVGRGPRTNEIFDNTDCKLIVDNTTITRVPFSVVWSKSIGYVSLCGYEGLSHDVFPSIIWSWMSPTNNPLCLVESYVGMSYLVSFDVPNNGSYDLLTISKWRRINWSTHIDVHKLEMYLCSWFSSFGKKLLLACLSRRHASHNWSRWLMWGIPFTIFSSQVVKPHMPTPCFIFHASL